jgi:DNA (cytosine-5)-methyltransferase 1
MESRDQGACGKVLRINRVVGLFAGVAGLELGLESAGFSTIAFAENDPHASAVLAEHFPQVPNRGDVSSLVDLPVAEIVTAGFPCQDLSPAGRLGGIHGGKSGLVEHVFRLLGKMPVRPKWLLFENVPFLLSFDGGSGMWWLTRQLESLNCVWAYRVVDTQAFGLPQRRRRLYLLASETADPRSVLFADLVEASLPKFDGSQACGFYWTEGNRGLGWAVDAIPPLKVASGVGIIAPPGVWLPHGGKIVIPSIGDAEAFQGFARGWTSPAEREPRGARARWRLVGNAVSVPTATWIGRRLIEPGTWDDSGSERIDADRPWPKAGWGSKGVRYAVYCSEWPVAAPRSGLSSIMAGDAAELSLRATRGFMTRLVNSRLKVEAPFKRDLQSHVERLQLAQTHAVHKPPDEGHEKPRQPLREKLEVEPLP